MPALFIGCHVGETHPRPRAAGTKHRFAGCGVGGFELHPRFKVDGVRALTQEFVQE